MKRRYWVYILGGAGRTIYVGMTSDLLRRIYEHKTQTIRGFSARYNLDRLLFYVEFHHPQEAIAYEKKIKGWVRRRKDALIEHANPQRIDLAMDWFSNADNNYK